MPCETLAQTVPASSDLQVEITSSAELMLATGCTQKRLEYHSQLKQLPNVREARQEEQRLAAEIAGLERTIQYKQADLKVSSANQPHKCKLMPYRRKAKVSN